MATKVNYKITILNNYTLWIRTGPGTQYPDIGILRGGQVVTVTETEGNWFHHQTGWSPFKDGGLNLVSIQDLGNQAQTVSQSVAASNTSQPTLYSNYTSNDINTPAELGDSDAVAAAFIKSVRGVHGMPYQFMESVDRRFDGSVFGRKFTEKIITNMPLLLITPGKPKFMKAFSVDEKQDIFKFLAMKEDGPIDNILGRDGRYYDLEFNYKDYYDYVNPMCQEVAMFLGISDKTIDGTALSKYTWQNYTNSAFKNFISSAETVAFYIDSENQITESFSNTTGESMLANKANSLSDMGRELQFLLGEGAGVTFDAINQENYDATLKDFQDFSDKYLKLAPQTLISKMASGFLTVASGGKMIFPEIWNDSSFSKSYSIQLKLRTPDYDNFSWYMNIAVPMLHLIGLVAPQEMGPNAYKSPFLVRAFYKGFFNCDMGIITGLSFAKGSQGKWTTNGLPTEVDVSLEIKDLYQVMTITKQSDIVNVMNNTALQDYLANMCGININKPDILRTLEIYKQQIINSKSPSAVIGKGFLSLEQELDNKLKDVFGIFRK